MTKNIYVDSVKFAVPLENLTYPRMKEFWIEKKYLEKDHAVNPVWVMWFFSNFSTSSVEQTIKTHDYNNQKPLFEVLIEKNRTTILSPKVEAIDFYYRIIEAERTQQKVDESLELSRKSLEYAKESFDKTNKSLRISIISLWLAIATFVADLVVHFW